MNDGNKIEQSRGASRRLAYTQPVIDLRSDNTSGIAPEIIDAVAAANSSSAAPYGSDAWTKRLRAQVREVFEHPTAEVFPVISGTAGNAIGLSALCPPWGCVLCHESSHALRSECGATSLFSAGAVIRGVPGHQYKVTLNGLRTAFDTTRWGDPHESQPSVLSLTIPTDYGTVYTPDEIKSLAQTARGRGLKLHIDGARIANAIAFLKCSPAELTWRAGADLITLGATKNGAMSADAIVCFDPRISTELSYRLKRAGHTPSKMRFLAAQLGAYLTGNLWLKLAERANSALRVLHAGLTARRLDVLNNPEANMVFMRLNPAAIRRLTEFEVMFYRIDTDTIRLVTSFQTRHEEIHEMLNRLDHALGQGTHDRKNCDPDLNLEDKRHADSIT